MRKPSTKRDLIDYLKLIGPGTIITILGFIIAYQFVEPAPPRHISIATGSLDSADYAFGKAYSEILQKYGYTLKVINTAGSAENLQLLEKADDGVDVAFLQGGTYLPTQSDELVSLGSLYYEPLWLFHATGPKINRLSDLRGKRIDVGREESGTKVLTMQLLALNDVSVKNTKIFSQGWEEAAKMLLQGEIDAAFFLTAYHSPVIRQLLYSKSLQLMNFII